MDPNLLLTIRIVVGLIMLLGAATLVIPVLPGMLIIWAGGLLYGLATGFTTTGWIIFAILTFLMLVGFIMDYLVMGATVKQGGASWLSVGLALIAGILGTLIFPPLGGLLAALLVIFGVEWLGKRDWRLALKSARHMVLGLGWATLVRVLFGLSMIVIWAYWAFWV